MRCVPFCTWFWRLQCTFVSIFYRTSKRNIQHLTDWINALKWSPFVQKKNGTRKKNCKKKKRVLFYEIEDGQILLSGIPVIYCCCTFGQPCHYHLIGKFLDNKFHLEFWFQILNSEYRFWIPNGDSVQNLLLLPCYYHFIGKFLDNRFHLWLNSGSGTQNLELLHHGQVFGP